MHGSESRYLAYTKQQAVRVGLEEFSLYYCNRLSYHEVAALLVRVSGQSLACEQTLHNWVDDQADVLNARLAKAVAICREQPLPVLCSGVDIYAQETQEVLVFTDGIGVKAQKPLRSEIIDYGRRQATGKSIDSSSAAGKPGELQTQSVGCIGCARHFLV